MPGFTLDQPIYYFNGVEPFTIADACEGVQIFGGIGSGKTSGSGSELAHAFLRAGFGGLVLCAKKDVLADWKRYAKNIGRENSILEFDASGNYVFPFLQYEIEREGEGAGYTENLVRLFTTVYEAIDQSKSNGGSDPYWPRAMQQLLRNIIDLCLIARGTVSMPLIQEVITSAPKSVDEIADEDWRSNSTCFKLLDEIRNKENSLDKWALADFDSTATYWLDEFPSLNSETRSGVVSMLTSMTDLFMRRPFRMLFSERPDNKKQIAWPELTHKGIVVILNLPVKEYGNAGRAAQIVYKYLWQQAVERREIIPGETRPVFLWEDESQNFVTEYDMQFQATARSSMACTVYLTQNLPNYYAEMGGEQSKYRVDSLVGNLQTKIWHANSDPTTNEHAANTIGKSWHKRHSSNESFSGESFNLSTGESESFDYDVHPQMFTMLKKGGKPNNNIVEAIIFQNGRIWDSNKKTHLLTRYNQQRK